MEQNRNQPERASVKVLKEAIELQNRKSQDYQNPLSRVRQADHYPRGVYTILDIVNGKLLRMYSVLETMEAGGRINFESVEDSAVDAINYLSFVVAYLRGEIDGQDPFNDIFNRRGQANPALIPEKFRIGTFPRGYDEGTITISTGSKYNFRSLTGVVNSWGAK